MIRVLVGENSFAITEKLKELRAAFSGTPESYDGDTLTKEQAADLFGGVTLFAEERFIVIRDLSKNSDIWTQLPELLHRQADTTTIILIEEKLDKRTATYKTLKKEGVIAEFPAWTDRDTGAASQWLGRYAKDKGVMLSTQAASYIVDRVGHDQWQLAAAVEKLSFVDVITKESIDEHIEAQPSENVFSVFELALSGNKQQLQSVLDTLMVTADPYATFALLSSQAVQLAVINEASAGDDVAKDFGIHPYVVSKLGRVAKNLGRREVARIVRSFAAADRQLKTSAADPWTIIRKTLLAV